MKAIKKKGITRVVAMLLALCMCLGVFGTNTITASAAATKTLVSSTTGSTTNGTKTTKTASSKATATKTTYTSWATTKTAYKVLSDTNSSNVAKIQETLTQTRIATSYTKGSKSYKTWTQTRTVTKVYNYNMSVSSVAPKVSSSIQTMMTTVGWKFSPSTTYVYGYEGLKLTVSVASLNSSSDTATGIWSDDKRIPYFMVAQAVDYTAGTYSSTSTWKTAYSSEKATFKSKYGLNATSASQYFWYAYYYYCTAGSTLKSKCPKTYAAIAAAEKQAVANQSKYAKILSYLRW